jgi:hypothetical protein
MTSIDPNASTQSLSQILKQRAAQPGVKADLSSLRAAFAPRGADSVKLGAKPEPTATYRDPSAILTRLASENRAVSLGRAAGAERTTAQPKPFSSTAPSATPSVASNTNASQATPAAATALTPTTAANDQAAQKLALLRARVAEQTGVDALTPNAGAAPADAPDAAANQSDPLSPDDLLKLVESSFNTTAGSANFNAQADLDGNNVVDVLDLNIVLGQMAEQNAGATEPPAAPSVDGILNAFNSAQGDDNFNAAQDLNGDGFVDVLDLNMMLSQQSSDT